MQKLLFLHNFAIMNLFRENWIVGERHSSFHYEIFCISLVFFLVFYLYFKFGCQEMRLLTALKMIFSTPTYQSGFSFEILTLLSVTDVQTLKVCWKGSPSLHNIIFHQKSFFITNISTFAFEKSKSLGNVCITFKTSHIFENQRMDTLVVKSCTLESSSYISATIPQHLCETMLRQLLFRH